MHPYINSGHWITGSISTLDGIATPKSHITPSWNSTSKKINWHSTIALFPNFFAKLLAFSCDVQKILGFCLCLLRHKDVAYVGQRKFSLGKPLMASLEASWRIQLPCFMEIPPWNVWYVTKCSWYPQNICPVWGSNSRPSDYETDTLPTALTRLTTSRSSFLHTKYWHQNSQMRAIHRSYPNFTCDCQSDSSWNKLLNISISFFFSSLSLPKSCELNFEKLKTDFVQVRLFWQTCTMSATLNLSFSMGISKLLNFDFYSRKRFFANLRELLFVLCMTTH